MYALHIIVHLQLFGFKYVPLGSFKNLDKHIRSNCALNAHLMTLSSNNACIISSDNSSPLAISTISVLPPSMEYAKRRTSKSSLSTYLYTPDFDILILENVSISIFIVFIFAVSPLYLHINLLTP